MMVNREYMLSDPDERMRQYKEFLAEALVKYHKRTFEQTMELFERQQDLYEKSLQGGAAFSGTSEFGAGSNHRI